MILRAAAPASLLLLLLLPGCGGSGGSKRGTASAPGVFPGHIAQAESTFNPSDYGIETWGENPDAGPGDEPSASGDSAAATVPDTIPGFRVQVTITEDIDFAGRLRDSLSQALPDEWVYVVYHPPYYKVRVGNFAERFAAAEMLDMLRRRGFPDAWIVPDRIPRNPPPRETPLPPDSTEGGDTPR